jgi:GT2 family glycosyltransferase
VAGGRNLLLDTEEARASDIIMFMDNDVIPTTDYVEGLASFLVLKKDAGVVGSTLLNVEPFLERHSKVFEEREGRFGGHVLATTNRTVGKIIRREFNSNMFYHIGSHPDWFDAYFSSRDIYENILVALTIIRKKRFFARMESDKRFSFRYLVNSRRGIRAGNVGGGAQAFFRRLIDEIGPLNQVFSPFGYEDADFCIRAIRKGYRNYVDTHTFLLHGTDRRQEKRNEFELGNKYINEYRCLTLLFYLHFPDTAEQLIRRRILYHYVDKYMTERERADEYLYFLIKGYRRGKEEILQKNLLPYTEK